MAALAGIIAVGLIGAASPQPDNTLPLNAIAAILLGGTSLAGGVGGVAGTALGVLLLGVLQNGLSLSGASTAWQQVVTGAILVVAVLADRLHLIRHLFGARARHRTERPGPAEHPHLAVSSHETEQLEETP
jgi:ribose transport system permease protein